MCAAAQPVRLGPATHYAILGLFIFLHLSFVFVLTLIDPSLARRFQKVHLSLQNDELSVHFREP